MRVARKKCGQEQRNLLAVAFASLNYSLLNWGERQLPMIIISSEPSTDEVFAAAEDWQFGLIRSDSLHSAYHWTYFSPLLHPLGAKVWTAIHLMTIMAAVLVTWPHYSEYGWAKKFLQSCYFMVRVLLQQPRQPVMEKHVNLEP